MNVLLTGAFGNLGSMVLDLLLKRGHHVTCFDLPNATNKKNAQHFTALVPPNQLTLSWGDIRDKALMQSLVEGKDAIIHLAAILPPMTEANTVLSWDINVKATEQLLQVAMDSGQPPLFLFASSFSVFGFTQHLPPPRTIDDPLVGTDNYSQQKIACEGLIRQYTGNWCLLRLGAAVDERMVHTSKAQMQLTFAVAGDNRIEYIHPADVAMAMANALECTEAHNRVMLIGGGKSCQVRHIDLVNAMSGAMGLTFKPEDFAPAPFFVDWMDTAESQRLLQFQNHSFAQFHDAAYEKFRVMRFFVRPLSPLIKVVMKWWLRW